MICTAPTGHMLLACEMPCWLFRDGPVGGANDACAESGAALGPAVQSKHQRLWSATLICHSDVIPC